MEKPSVTVKLTPEDIVAFIKYQREPRDVRLRILRQMIWLGILVVALILGSLIAYDVSMSNLRGTPKALLLYSPSVWISVVVIVGFVGFTYVSKRRLLSEDVWKKDYPSMFLPTLYQVLDEGFYTENDQFQTLLRWMRIARVEETPTCLIVFEVPKGAHILPKRCFVDLESVAIFAEQVRLQIESSPKLPV
jgi:hypothetical protein